MNIKKLFPYILSLGLFSNANSQEKKLEESKLNNLKNINIKTHFCKAGYLANDFYVTTKHGNFITNNELIEKVIFTYRVNEEIKNIYQIESKYNELNRSLDYAIIQELIPFMKFKTSKKESTWWMEIPNIFNKKLVDPVLIGKHMVGNMRNSIKPYCEKISNLSNKLKTNLDYDTADELLESIMYCDSIAPPAIDFLRSINNNSQTFKINPEDEKMNNEIKYKNDPISMQKSKELTYKIIKRIENSPEMSRFNSEFRMRLQHWGNLSYINNSNEYRNLKR